MKKLIFTGIVASIFSSSTVSADDVVDGKEMSENGVRLNAAIGPFYDSIFDLASSVIPTLAYETTPGAKTSVTKLFGIYGTNDNWVARAESNNHFGGKS